MIENVTNILNAELACHADIQEALAMLAGHLLLGRETRSAATGELTEHLVTRLLKGSRVLNGNKGHDVLSADSRKIEVKSRLIGRWGDSLIFNFSSHTENADQVYCVAWNDQPAGDRISEAYTLPVVLLVKTWGRPHLPGQGSRTTLGKLRTAYKAQG